MKVKIKVEYTLLDRLDKTYLYIMITLHNYLIILQHMIICTIYIPLETLFDTNSVEIQIKKKPYKKSNVKKPRLRKKSTSNM